MAHQFMLIVANEPAAEKEAEYNDWYTQKHVPMMFNFPGMRKASRYHLIGDNRESSKYLAVYEFDCKEDLEAFPQSQEFREAVADFDQQWQDGGFMRRWAASYELVKSWEKTDRT
jgi:antibiotic biosynthesis monooxygenase (ABM) superfamily enzyme